MSANDTCSDPEVGALLASYEMDLLADEQRAAFEKHLTRCEACLDELYRTAPYTTAMRAAPKEVLARLGPHAQELGRSAGARPVSPRPWWTRLRMPILVPVAAAAVAVLLVLRPPGGPGSISDLAIIEPLPWATVETRAGEDEQDRLFQIGMADYASGDYGAAVTWLLLAVDLGERDPGGKNLDQARLFLGLSLLLTGDPETGRPHLETVARSDVPPLRDRARWLLAQSRLLTGDGEGALEILDALSSSPGYGPRASDLATKVRALIE